MINANGYILYFQQLGLAYKHNNIISTRVHLELKLKLKTLFSN